MWILVETIYQVYIKKLLRFKLKKQQHLLKKRIKETKNDFFFDRNFYLKNVMLKL